MYPAILVLYRLCRIDGKLRLDSDDSREHSSFKPPESFQVSQLRAISANFFKLGEPSREQAVRRGLKTHENTIARLTLGRATRKVW